MDEPGGRTRDPPRMLVAEEESGREWIDKYAAWEWCSSSSTLTGWSLPRRGGRTKGPAGCRAYSRRVYRSDCGEARNTRFSTQTLVLTSCRVKGDAHPRALQRAGRATRGADFSDFASGVTVKAGLVYRRRSCTEAGREALSALRAVSFSDASERVCFDVRVCWRGDGSRGGASA